MVSIVSDSVKVQSVLVKLQWKMI